MPHRKVPTRKPKPKGFFKRRIGEINRILAKRPPLEELNKLWCAVKSFKKMCKILKVPLKTLQIWMGSEYHWKDPNRYYGGETLSWGKESDLEEQAIKKEKKMITEIYKIGRRNFNKED